MKDNIEILNPIYDEEGNIETDFLELNKKENCVLQIGVRI